MAGRFAQIYADNNPFFLNIKNLHSLARRICLAGQRPQKGNYYTIKLWFVIQDLDLDI
jgi:hypothetical protein